MKYQKKENIMKYRKIDEGLLIGVHYDVVNSKRKNNPIPLRRTTVSVLIPSVKTASNLDSTKSVKDIIFTHSVTQYLRDKDDKYLAKKICIKKLFEECGGTLFPGGLLTKSIRTKVWKWFLKNN